MKLNNSGKATVRANVKAGKSESYTISGKDFKNLNIRQTGGDKFQYEFRVGSRILSTGHVGEIKASAKSEGKSVYRLTVMNKSNKTASIRLAFTGSD